MSISLRFRWVWISILALLLQGVVVVVVSISSIDEVNNPRRIKTSIPYYFTLPSSSSPHKIRTHGWTHPNDEVSSTVHGHVFSSSSSSSSSSLPRCNIDRQPNITNENFRKYYLGKKPVILGSSLYNLNITINDLQNYISKIGNLPYALFTPVGKPSVGGKIIRFAEYLATFTTQGERDNVVNNSFSSSFVSTRGGGNKGSMDEIYSDSLPLSFGGTIATSFHCNPLSSSMHKELIRELLQFRHRLSMYSDSVPRNNHYPEHSNPYLAHPVVCMAHGNAKDQQRIKEEQSSSSSFTTVSLLSPFCQCSASFLVVGESGSGLPWHFHAQVHANELLIGNKRWFLSRHSPPGGFNHRRSHYEWVRDIYPTLDSSVFDTVPPATEPALYECTLVPGEIMYVPDSWYHATLDVGHAISVIYDNCDNDATMNRQNKVMQVTSNFHSSSEPLLWVPFPFRLSGSVKNPSHQYFSIDYPSFRNGAKHWIERLRELHTYTVQDPYLDSTLGSINTKITEDLYIILSGAGKANHAVQLSAPTDGISMNLAALTPVVDFEELKIAEFACALWPTEPEFLLATGRSYLRLARDWIKENALPSSRRPAASYRSSNNDDNGMMDYASQPIVATLVKETALPFNFAVQMMEQSIPRLFYAIKINPYYPDAFVLLSYSIDTRIGIEGWLVNRSNTHDSVTTTKRRDSYEQRIKTKRKTMMDTGSKKGNSNNVEYYQYNDNSYYLLDIALAAARRTLLLDPFSIAACNQISILLGKGALDRFLFTRYGKLIFHPFVHHILNISIPNDLAIREKLAFVIDASEGEEVEEEDNGTPTIENIPVDSSGRQKSSGSFPPDGDNGSLSSLAKFSQQFPVYTKRWMKLRGSSTVDMYRLERVYTQVLQCIDIGTKSIPISSSKDTKTAIEKDLEETFHLLRIVQNQRDKVETQHTGLSYLWYTHPYETELQRIDLWNQWIRLTKNKTEDDQYYRTEYKQLLPLYIGNLEYSSLVQEPFIEQETMPGANNGNNPYGNTGENEQQYSPPSFHEVYQYLSTAYRYQYTLD